MKLLTLCATALALLFAPGQVKAALIGHIPGTGGPGGGIIAAPPSVVDDASGGGAVNLQQQGFNELQNVLLPVAIAHDFGVIAAGTLVSSHMIFLNTLETGPGAIDNGVQWLFDGNIIGVMSNTPGTLEAASTPILGNPGTIYPGAFPNRGLEPNNGYVGVGNQLTVNMQVTEPGDWIRVVTAVPEPSTLLLLGTGLVGLVGYARRRNAA